ncbi:MAG: hypothetical protein IPK68_11100 [Bdellovibrionales bacterium]|nr:hypothetical protein [Bdellovibrionales bacterium]
MRLIFVIVLAFSSIAKANYCIYDSFGKKRDCFSNPIACKQAIKGNNECRKEENKIVTINDLPKPNPGTCLWVEEDGKWKLLSCVDMKEGCEAQKNSFPKNIKAECR